jgi:hypothetical protein
MRRLVVAILLVASMFTLGINANAQVKNGVHSKLAKYFENEQWEDLAFKCDKMMIQEKYKNDAELYLYSAYAYAKIFTMCLDDPKLLDKTPEYLQSYNLALRYSVNAKKKDKKAKILFPDNDDLLKDIAVIGMYYVDHYVSVKKYSKANSKVRKMLKTYSDDNFVTLQGCLAAITGDTATANPIMRNLEQLAEKGKRREKDTDFAMIDAFDIYATWLLNKETPDTDEAKKILALGLKFFPDEPVLVYDLEIAKNPEYATEHAKPENAKKAEFMVKASAITDDDDEDDEDDE